MSARPRKFRVPVPVRDQRESAIRHQRVPPVAACLHARGQRVRTGWPLPSSVLRAAASAAWRDGQRLSPRMRLRCHCVGDRGIVWRLGVRRHCSSDAGIASEVCVGRVGGFHCHGVGRAAREQVRTDRDQGVRPTDEMESVRAVRCRPSRCDHVPRGTGLHYHDQGPRWTRLVESLHRTCRSGQDATFDCSLRGAVSGRGGVGAAGSED